MLTDYIFLDFVHPKQTGFGSLQRLPGLHDIMPLELVDWTQGRESIELTDWRVWG